MSTATRKSNHATYGVYTVAGGGSATAGCAVILSGADDTVTIAPTGSDLAIGIALTTAVAGARVEVCLFNHVEAVLVAAGGATRGAKALIVNGAFQDAPAHATTGNTSNQIYGIFMQSGVSGDMVGLMLAPSNRGSA